MSKPPPRIPSEGDNLRALQTVWYNKLKEEGFKDIEDTSSSKRFLKTWHSTYFQSRYSPDSFEMKQDYYRRAGRFLYLHQFDSLLEREVWEFHSNGMSLREIAEELKKRGIKTNKDTVHKTICKLLELMKSCSDDE